MANRNSNRPHAHAGTWPPQAVPAAGVVRPDAGPWPSLITTLQTWARAEAGPGRLLPWVPVAFGAGIALYFAAEHEPVAWVAGSIAAVLAGAALLSRRQRWFPLVVVLAAVAAGFAIAALKTARIAHGVLAKPIYGVALSGFVETHEERERTDRFVLRLVTMESPRSPVQLERVRLSVRKGAAPSVGSFV